MQTIFQEVDGALRQIDLPDEDCEVLPGVAWGSAHTPFTAAFWAGRFRAHELLGTFGRFRTGNTLAEELGHCLLGGHGIPAEVGWAAYQRLRNEGLFGRATTAIEIEDHLREPLAISGRHVRYRFARRKASQLARALEIVRDEYPSRLNDAELRMWLMGLPGVGPKTASWVVRNHRGSDLVAIIDIHIERAGKIAGFFPGHMSAARHYLALETMFLRFANAIEAPASLLDHMMWNIMKKIGWQISHA